MVTLSSDKSCKHAGFKAKKLKYHNFSNSCILTSTLNLLNWLADERFALTYLQKFFTSGWYKWWQVFRVVSELFSQAFDYIATNSS